MIAYFSVGKIKELLCMKKKIFAQSNENQDILISNGLANIH